MRRHEPLMAGDVVVAEQGYRVYRDEVGGRRLWLDAGAAFHALIDRYGMPITLGPHAGRFIRWRSSMKAKLSKEGTLVLSRSARM